MKIFRRVYQQLTIGLLTSILFCTMAGTVSADEQTAQWVAPVVAGYGYFNPLPKALFQPNTKQQYKVVFDVTKANDDGGVNKGLRQVARVVNLFGINGKPAKNFDAVVILHGHATRAVLNNTAFKARYGHDNPDIDIIEKLQAAGVTVHVCGQAIVDNGYYYQNVNDNVSVVLGAIQAEIELTTNGYSLIYI